MSHQLRPIADPTLFIVHEKRTKQATSLSRLSDQGRMVAD